MDSMRRTVLVLSMLALSMGATTGLLHFIERRIRDVPPPADTPSALASAPQGGDADPLR